MKHNKISIIVSVIMILNVIVVFDTYAAEVQENELNKNAEIEILDSAMERVKKDIEEVEKPEATKPHKKKSHIKKVTMSLPSGSDGDFKAYMDFRCITNTSSKQYSMQQKAHTDNNGLRKIDNAYCVAMGTGFSSKLGTKFEIKTSDGNTFTVILADIKADQDTDCSDKYCSHNSSIVEFIVDTNVLNSDAKLMGSIGAINEFSGSITSIKKIVKK